MKIQIRNELSVQLRVEITACHPLSNQLEQVSIQFLAASDYLAPSIVREEVGPVVSRASCTGTQRGKLLPSEDHPSNAL